MVALAGSDLDADDVPARLLGHFDALLLGYASRDLVLDAAHAKKVQAGGGFIQPTVLVGGRVVGTWSLDRKGKAAAVVTPFGRLPGGSHEALAEETADLARFLGHPVGLSVAG
jgi:hypothetical protein